MRKKKKLGSTPIGSHSGTREKSSFDFIRKFDRSGSTDTTVSEQRPADTNGNGKEERENSVSNGTKGKSEKKIVSYYLERNLIKRIKTMANEEGLFYSALVGEALKSWINEHGY